MNAMNKAVDRILIGVDDINVVTGQTEFHQHGGLSRRDDQSDV